MSLLDSLGLDDVAADPNDIPDGPYVGVVKKSEFVHNKKANTYSHVITYSVTEGERKGAERQEWFTLGEVTATDEAGKPTALTPTMKDSQKPWYKKRWLDLGVTEEEFPTKKNTPEILVGTPVRFGVKRNNGYININFAEKHVPEGATASPAAPEGGIGGLI
jgi:hypothetical protein